MPVHHPRTGAPHKKMIETFRQRTIWITADGTVIPVSKMETDHLWAVLGWMRWYAPQLAALMPARARGKTMDDFLCGLPIWKSIAAQLAKRRELGSAKNALKLLRLEGMTDWERRAAEAYLPTIPASAQAISARPASAQKKGKPGKG